ncbi:MAG: hypothetical protein CR966_00930 [Pseudomonadales bacterium]|nr:MAG: hypothetical protein CR966_00930 [Pseudomonadales bacterium]
MSLIIENCNDYDSEDYLRDIYIWDSQATPSPMAHSYEGAWRTDGQLAQMTNMGYAANPASRLERVKDDYPNQDNPVLTELLIKIKNHLQTEELSTDEISSEQAKQANVWMLEQLPALTDNLKSNNYLYINFQAPNKWIDYVVRVFDNIPNKQDSYLYVKKGAGTLVTPTGTYPMGYDNALEKAQNFQQRLKDKKIPSPDPKAPLPTRRKGMMKLIQSILSPLLEPYGLTVNPSSYNEYLVFSYSVPTDFGKVSLKIMLEKKTPPYNLEFYFRYHINSHLPYAKVLLKEELEHNPRIWLEDGEMYEIPCVSSENFSLFYMDSVLDLLNLIQVVESRFAELLTAKTLNEVITLVAKSKIDNKFPSSWYGLPLDVILFRLAGRDYKQLADSIYAKTNEEDKAEVDEMWDEMMAYVETIEPIETYQQS